MRSAIAAEGVRRAGMAVDAARWGRVVEWNRVKLAEADDALRTNAATAGVFHRGGDRRVLFTARRQPRVDGDRLRGWLRAAAAGLFDRNNDPAFPTDRGPPHDPEAWGFWAEVAPTVRAWRDLLRSARVAAVGVEAGVAYPPAGLDLPGLSALVAWIHQSGIQPFRPRSGCRFLVVHLPHLATACLAGLCSARRYASSRHVEMRLSARPERLAPLADWVEEAASFLSAVRSDAGDDHVTPLDYHRRVDFDRLRTTDHAEFSRWTRAVAGLLAVLPAGLPPEHGRQILGQVYGAVLSAAEYDRAAAVLATSVFGELQGFLADDAADADADLQGEDFETKLRGRIDANSARSGRLFDNLGTYPDYIRRRAAEAGDATRLHRHGLALDGRVVPRGPVARVRRQEWELSVEAVRADVAFTLTSGDHKLVAVEGDRFYLEAATDDPDETGRAVSGAVRRAQERWLIPNLVRPPDLEWRDEW